MRKYIIVLTKLKWKTWVIILLTISAIAIYNYSNFSSPGDAMKALPLGSTYDELLIMAGKPSYVTNGTLWVEPQYKKSKDQLIDGCIKEAWYESYVFPGKYSFCFNANGLLIDKYHWQSW